MLSALSLLRHSSLISLFFTLLSWLVWMNVRVDYRRMCVWSCVWLRNLNECPNTKFLKIKIILMSFYSIQHHKTFKRSSLLLKLHEKMIQFVGKRISLIKRIRPIFKKIKFRRFAPKIFCFPQFCLSLTDGGKGQT